MKDMKALGMESVTIVNSQRPAAFSSQNRTSKAVLNERGCIPRKLESEWEVVLGQV